MGVAAGQAGNRWTQRILRVRSTFLQADAAKSTPERPQGVEGDHPGRDRRRLRLQADVMTSRIPLGGEVSCVVRNRKRSGGEEARCLGPHAGTRATLRGRI